VARELHGFIRKPARPLHSQVRVFGALLISEFEIAWQLPIQGLHL
jgi:hypothetical protein